MKILFFVISRILTIGKGNTTNTSEKNLFPRPPNATKKNTRDYFRYQVINKLKNNFKRRVKVMGLESHPLYDMLPEVKTPDTSLEESHL